MEPCKRFCRPTGTPGALWCVACGPVPRPLPPVTALPPFRPCPDWGSGGFGRLPGLGARRGCPFPQKRGLPPASRGGVVVPGRIQVPRTHACGALMARSPLRCCHGQTNPACGTISHHARVDVSWCATLVSSPLNSCVSVLQCSRSCSGGKLKIRGAFLLPPPELLPTADRIHRLTLLSWALQAGY
jgi:hypothetical protein